MIRLIVIAVLFMFLSAAYSAEVSDVERTIFVGDSITFQGGVYSKGWQKIIQQALREINTGHPEGIILLGGCGQSVGSWLGVCKRALERDESLGDKRYKVKSELAKGADNLVIMLGMNDVIGPYVNDTLASIEKWIGRYDTLITTLKERCKPRQVYIATITMHTEDPLSAKNILITKLNKKIHSYANEKGCKVIETAAEYWKVFDMARRYKADFHIVPDYVHPNEQGHWAIATAMLRGLGHDKAANYVQSKYYATLNKQLTSGRRGLSWKIVEDSESTFGSTQKFKLTVYPYNFTDDKNIEIKVKVPDGWIVRPEAVKGQGGFTLSGNPEKLRNVFIISADNGKVEAKVSISAPWLVCHSIAQPHWAYRKPLDLDKTKTLIDEKITEGKDFLKTSPKVNSKLPAWKLYYPNFNFTGGDDPNSVDYSRITIERPHDAGYGVRWIYSPKDMPVKLRLASKVFAGNIQLTVWLNSSRVYCKEITAVNGRKDYVNASLRKGWNCLVFKSNHRAWLWQNSVAVVDPNGNEIPDLKYSCIPQTSVKNK